MQVEDKKRATLKIEKYREDFAPLIKKITKKYKIPKSSVPAKLTRLMTTRTQRRKPEDMSDLRVFITFY